VAAAHRAHAVPDGKARRGPVDSGAGRAAGGARAPAWGLDADAGQALELAHALRGLPPEQRALLGLHYIEGLEADELAAVHGVSRGAVEQRLHRARHALRRALGAPADPQSCTAVKEG